VKPLRVGVIRYLLNRPLIRGLYRHPSPGIELCEDVPARLGERLVAGDLDVSLAPMGLLLVAPERLRVLPGIGVGCDGAVMSVRLFRTAPMSQVRSVSLDGSSRSGALLTRVLLERYEGLSPQYHVRSGDLPMLLANAEAALVIGDPALRAMGGTTASVDLGEQWKLRTGLGYVFAVWAFRTGLPDEQVRDLSGMLEESLEAGERDLGEIIAEEADCSSLPPGLVATYLGGAIRYRLGGAPVEGLVRAVDEARELGIVGPDARLPEGMLA
jgi:chorismate dehydratase